MKASLTRTLQFLLAVVGAGAFAIVNIAPADAATDVAAPLIGSSRVTTTTLDATNSEASLVFSVNLTDETAVSDFVGRIRHPATGQSYFLSNEFLAAGTAQDGTWQATATIPKGSAPGQWVIQLFAITDTLANQTSGFFDLQTVTVTSASADIAAPAIVSNAVTKTTLDATNAADSLIFSVRLTDETAVSDYVARLRHPATGQSYFLSTEYLATGTKQNGVWRATAGVPRGAAPGQWVIELFAITDTLANQTSGFFNVRTITVRSASTDVAAPAIVSNAVTKTTLDATNAADSLIFSVRLTDETAVSDYVARLRHPATGQSYFLSTEYLATGTKQNGVWRATAGVPRGAAPGQWVIELFAITDTLANQTSGFFNVRTITVK